MRGGQARGGGRGSENRGGEGDRITLTLAPNFSSFACFCIRSWSSARTTPEGRAIEFEDRTCDEA